MKSSIAVFIIVALALTTFYFWYQNENLEDVIESQDDLIATYKESHTADSSLVEALEGKIEIQNRIIGKYGEYQGVVERGLKRFEAIK